MRTVVLTRQLRAYAPFLMIAGYCSLILLLRLYWRHQNLQLDEAEQMVKAQQFQWGYSAQPPLYTYLQHAFFLTFGKGLSAVTLLRCLLIGTSLLTYYYLNRTIFNSDKIASLSTLSWGLLPSFSKKIPWVFTDSLAVLLISNLTLFWFFRPSRPALWYIILGLLIGLGGLSKYNYFLFFTALLLSEFICRKNRLAFKKLLISLSLGFILLSPYLFWCYQHSATAFASHIKLQGEQTRVVAYFKFLYREMLFCLPLLLAFCLCFMKELEPSVNKGLFKRFAVYLLSLNGLIFLAYLFNFISSFSRSWFIPLLFMLPSFLFSLVDTDKLTHYRQRFYLLLCMLGILFGLGFGIIAKSKIFGTNQYTKLPTLTPLARAIQSENDRGTLVSTSRILLGNLMIKLKNFNGLHVLSPNYQEGLARQLPFLITYPCQSNKCVKPAALKGFINKNNLKIKAKPKLITIEGKRFAYQRAYL